MALYDRVRDLPLVVEGYDLDGHHYDVRADFTRKTTVIRLAGQERRVSVRTSPTTASSRTRSRRAAPS